MNSIKIEFDAVPENEAFARVAISGFLMYLDPTLNDLSDIKTAISEAVTNSIIHGYDNRGGKIVMKCVENEKNVHIEIADKGMGIDDVEKARKPLFTTKPSEERAGLGFTVMEAFMDNLQVISKVGMGTTIVMDKQL